ncbi:flagellar biosynthetic protein FliR (plasmid) [Citricoccus nitrophenolicus]
MELTLGYEWLQAYLLVVIRVTLFIAIAPPFSNNSIPWRAKSILAAGLALALAGRVEVPAGGLSAGDLVTAATSEAATGAVLGILVMVAFAAIPAAGSLIDLAGGFSMAAAYDPGSSVNGAQFTRLFQNGAYALMFASGAYIPVFLGLAKSLDVLALGQVPDMGNAAASAGMALAGMFAAAAQIAAPLIAVLFLADVGLGLLTKVAPTLNAFSLGFPLKILITLSFGGMIFMVLPLVVGQLTDAALKLMGQVIGT